MIAANNLASLLIKQNRADTTLLKPFITQDAPSAILVNQTVAYLQKRDFKKQTILQDFCLIIKRPKW